MIIRRKIYWHAAVIANSTGDFDPTEPAGPQSAISTLQQNGDTTDAWLSASAADYIYGVKNCRKIPVSLNVSNDEILDVDTNGNTVGLRADNPLVAPGEIRFALPPDALSQLLGDPVEVTTASDLINLQKKPIRYRLFAVYKSGPGISCSDRSVPDAWFSSENVPEEVVPFNDGASRSEIEQAMGPVADVDSAGGETGFYVKIKRYESITRIGCCGIDATGVTPSSSSSSSLPGTGNCPASPLPTYASDASEYRIWMLRQNANTKMHGDSGVAELAYADLTNAIDTNFGSINPSAVEWNHAGFINFEDVSPQIYESLANPISYGNQTGERDRGRLIVPRMFDQAKDMPVHLQHISWDNRGFLWALGSGGFKMLPSDNPSSATNATFTTTEGIYRLIPGGWYYATSSAYCWGGGNTGCKVGASLIEPIVGRFRQVAAGYVESNASPYTAFNVFLDEDGMIHVRAEGWNSTNVRASWPNFNANGVRFSEIDAGNGMICAVSTSGKLHAWNMLSPSDAANWTINQATVAAISASTNSYLHCCVSLTSPCAFVLASRQDGITVDKFTSAGSVNILSIPAGSVVQRLSAGLSWSAAHYIDSSGIGKIVADGYIFSNTPGNQLSAIIGNNLNSSNVVDMDGGAEYVAVCYKPASDPLSDSYLRTFAAPKASGYMIPDELRVPVNQFSGQRVYAGYDRFIVVDSSNNYRTYGADNYIYTSNIYTGSSEGAVLGSLGRCISTGIHAKDGINGSRKYAVLVAGHPDDVNNGSVSIWIKYLPDAATGSSTGQNPNGRWTFLKKIYANSFTGSWSNSEFGMSAFVAGNNDIIVGAPGARKVCIIRKSTSSIDYSAHAVISSPTASPESLTSDNRFGHIVKWLPIGSAYGSIIISAPTITSNSSATANGALVISAYNDSGSPDARRKALRISDFITGQSFSASRFGSDLDACMPVIASSAGIVPGRYNIAVSDTISNKVLQFNLKADATDLAQIIGNADVFSAPAEYASSVLGSTICVQYTSKSSSLSERKPQLAVSWTNDLAPTSFSNEQRGDVWIFDPQVDASSGTLNYDTNIANATKLERVIPNSTVVLNLNGTSINADNGVMVVTSSAYIILGNNNFVRNFHDVYTIKDSPSPSGKPIWEKTSYLAYTSIGRSNYTDIFPSSGAISNFKIYPGTHVSFIRQYLGCEIMTQGFSASTAPQKFSGFIDSYVVKEYPFGMGRRLQDVDPSMKNIPVKCAAAGLKHQVLIAADGSNYSIPRYIDARLCTSSPIFNDDNIAFDQAMKIAVPNKDPIDGSPADENLYHFGSMAAFAFKEGSLGPDYSIFNLPIYSPISKTVRIAETHWKPFKILDQPIDYGTLAFSGYAKFKPKCDPTSPPPSFIQGQSGAFNTPRLDIDGTVEADIDNFENARSMINTAQVFYKSGASGEVASYTNSIIGAVSPSTAINSPGNASDPLDGNLENVEFVPLYCSFSTDTTSNVNLETTSYSYLYPIKFAYKGHFRQYPCTSANSATNNCTYPLSVQRYGITPWSQSDLSDSQKMARKVVWNCIGEEVKDIKGRLKLYNCDILCSYLQPSSANKSDNSLYSGSDWHRYLSHTTDTAHNVGILERQSVFADSSGKYNPLSESAIYSPTTAGVIPSHGYRVTDPATAPAPYSVFFNIQNGGTVNVSLSAGRLTKFRSITNPPQQIVSTLSYYDFTGRGSGVLVSHRGSRVCWSKLHWPVLRNQLSFIGSLNYLYHIEVTNQPPSERNSGFAPGWRDNNINNDDECIISGMTKFPIAPGSGNSYGVATGHFVLANTNSSITNTNSQIAYLYSLAYIQQPSGTRSPVDLSASGTFSVNPALHAIGCAGIYIENPVDPNANELLMLSAATFSCGAVQGSPNYSAIPGRQHVWLQKRIFNGNTFSNVLVNAATTLPQPTDINQLLTGGWEFKPTQGNFRCYDGNLGMVCGSNTLLKTIKNNTSINVWEVGSAADPIAVVAVGGRAFSMRRNASGSAALQDAIASGSISSIMNQVIEVPMQTGSYYNIWVAAFDNESINPPLNFGRTVMHSVSSSTVNMAVALGGGIPFYINGVAHVWYAGYVYRIDENISSTANPIGGVSLTDVTTSVLGDVIDILGTGSSIAGDFIQGFASGYANKDWFVISNTKDETDTIRVFKINPANARLEFDSSIDSGTLGLSFNIMINTPYKIGVIINSSGSSIVVCNHQFVEEASQNNLSNEYKTGYSNSDAVSVFVKSGSSWLNSGTVVASDVTGTANRSISNFAESITLNEADSLLVVSSGSDLANRTTASSSDIAESFYLSDTSAKRKRPGKLHAFNINPQNAASEVAECNDLVSFSTAGFVGSAYNNLNFWASVPVTAKNGSQSMAFSSVDSSMYFSTLGEMMCIKPKKEGSWKLAGSSNSGKQTSSLSIFKYPYPSGICFNCATSVASGILVPKAPRVTSGLASGNISDGKRAMAYRPTVSPSILGVDVAPASSSPSAGLSDVVTSYGENGATNAPYFRKLNDKTDAGEWDQVNGYKLSYNPSTRAFIKRYELNSASGMTGVGASLLNSEIVGPTYKASFATCPPVWDDVSGMWSWAGISAMKMSSSPVYDRALSSSGYFGQLSYSDVFGLSCFQFNTSFIYAFRETNRDIVSANDDTAPEHIAHLTSVRETDMDSNGADVTTRTGQVILVKSPNDPNAVGNVTSSVALPDFFSSGTGSRFVMNGPGSVTVGSTNAGANSKDQARICKSGLPPFARNRTASSLGSVLILVDDSSSMDAFIPAATVAAYNDHDDIPTSAHQLMPLVIVDDSLNSRFKLYGNPSSKYSVDNESPLHMGTKFNRIIRSLLRMLDPLEGDIFLGDQILISCSSSLSSPNPTSQIFPAAQAGKVAPILCVCQADAVTASMKIGSWRTNSTSDIFEKIVKYAPDGTYARGTIFDIVSPPSNTNKFDHVIIMCGDLVLPSSVSSDRFADEIYAELTRVGSQGLLKNGANVHVVDLSPDDKREFKEKLGAYGTYSIWRGGGM